jgi:hypothetical protein
MERTRFVKALAVAAALPLLELLVDIAPNAPLGLTLVPEVHTVVGAPLTPLLVGGVARRATVRAAFQGNNLVYVVQ